MSSDVPVYPRQSQPFLGSAGCVAVQSTSFLETDKPVSVNHGNTNMKNEKALGDHCLA